MSPTTEPATTAQPEKIEAPDAGQIGEQFHIYLKSHPDIGLPANVQEFLKGCEVDKVSALPDAGRIALMEALHNWVKPVTVRPAYDDPDIPF